MINPLLAADTGGDYVAAAYLVFLLVLLIYLGIMAGKLVRIQSTLSEILRKVDKSDGAKPGSDDN